MFWNAANDYSKPYEAMPEMKSANAATKQNPKYFRGDELPTTTTQAALAPGKKLKQKSAAAGEGVRPSDFHSSPFFQWSPFWRAAFFFSGGRPARAGGLRSVGSGSAVWRMISSSGVQGLGLISIAGSRTGGMAGWGGAG